MTPADKEKIRRRILATGQQDIGEVHPDCFLSATVGEAKLFPMLTDQPNTAVMMGAFLSRGPAADGKRHIKPLWQFAMN